MKVLIHLSLNMNIKELHIGYGKNKGLQHIARLLVRLQGLFER